MSNATPSRLALFDLDHTLLPLDSDYEWNQFLVRIGAVNAAQFEERNAVFYQQYQQGTLNPVEYLDFVFEVLGRFPRSQLDAWHDQFMAETIAPAMLPAARDLVEWHQGNGDLVAIVTATNRFVTAPIAHAFEVEHLIAAEPLFDSVGNIVGRVDAVPPFGVGKITNLHAWLDQRGTPLDTFESSHFYSDSQNDIPLLSLVTHPVATNPNALLEAHADACGWPILHLFQ